MMAAFNVTALPDFGYPETTKYIDPMEARWRAKAFTADEFSGRTGVFSDASIQEAVESSALANPYADVVGVQDALDKYYGVTNELIKARKHSDDSDDADDASQSDDSNKNESDDDGIKHGNATLSGTIPHYRRFSS